VTQKNSRAKKGSRHMDKLRKGGEGRRTGCYSNGFPKSSEERGKEEKERSASKAQCEELFITMFTIGGEKERGERELHLSR